MENNAINKQTEDLYVYKTGGDPFIHFEISGGGQCALGLDDNDSDQLKLTDNVDPSTGNTIFDVDFATPNVHFYVNQLSQEYSKTTGIGFLLNNQDNTTATADARLSVRVGGASGGDPYILFDGNQGGAKSGCVGIDNDTNLFLITRQANAGASNISGNTAFQLTNDGEITEPLQPAFLAYLTAADNDVTGGGTTYTLINWDSEVFDQNSDFTVASGTFTAPVTGRYRFEYCILVWHLNGASTGNARVVTSNATCLSQRCNPTNVEDGAGSGVSYNGSVLADMDAADTCYLTIQHTGSAGGDDNDIYGDASGTRYTYFSGQLEV